MCLRGVREFVSDAQALYSAVVAKMGTLPCAARPCAAGADFRQGAADPDSLWAATQEELLREESAARESHGMSKLHVGQGSGDWAYLLTENQRGYLRDHIAHYYRLHQRHAETDRWVVFNLSQRPRWGQPIKDGSIPTLRRDSSRIWSPARKRWMLFSERATCMGYPVHIDLARSAGVDVDSHVLMGPSAALGNAMHISSVGMAIGVACLASEECTAKG